MPEDIDQAKPLQVRRGRVESVDLYEIKEGELDLIEKGSPADLQLNFAIFLLSIAFSAFCALYSATFSNQKIEMLFTVVSVVGLILGGYMLLAWRRNRTSLKDVCTTIRERMPPASDNAGAPRMPPDTESSDLLPKG